jgi:predicted amidohydrolase YtcJ
MSNARFSARIVAAACATLVVGCAQSGPKLAADTIYTGGDIVTVNDATPSAEAVAVKDGRIVAVGSRADVEKAHKAASTTMNDLAGRTLVPAFIDPHSHYINSLSMANQVNVFAPPAGPGKDVDAIVEALVKFRDARKIPAGEVIMAYGYDETSMPGGRILGRDDLDRDFPDNPVLVGHTSLHGAVLNSAAFRKYGISAATRTPHGGIIVRKPGSNEPAGLVMETAWLPIFSSLPNKPPAGEEAAWTRAGQMIYAAAGITTAQDGATHLADFAVMERAAEQGANLIDVVAYPFILELDEFLKDHPAADFGKYRNGLKLGGVKITLDGSPQGRTAFFTTPYLVDGPNGEKNWTGELPFPQETVNGWFRQVYDHGLQLLVHANGDAAIDVLLRAHQSAAAGRLDEERRTTVIHSQFVRPDQLDKYVAYRIVLSFFTEHTFYFGETHAKQRGEEQANFLSPMRAAINKGLRPTNHTDFNVSPIDQMMVLWTAVNRLSREGRDIGADQRVTPLEALEAITINAAYQYFEEKSKGSIETGKLANLVILDRNPLTVDPMSIKDIRVLETIKEGKTIYKAD